MDDDGDDKDDTKRRTRNLSEKKRRDQFNMLVTELSTLITTNNRKMDKSTVLKSTISFLKNHNEVTVQSHAHDIQEDWKPAFLSNEEFTYLVLEALEGFVMVFSASGRINYVSESITSLLGHNPVYVVNKSIFDLAFEEDRPNLYNLLKRNDMATEPNSSKEIEMIRFQIHLRRGSLDLRENVSYDLVQFYGHFLKIPGSEVDEDRNRMGYQQDQDSRMLFICIGRLHTPQLIRDVSLVDSSRNEFTSRYSLEWKYLFLDNRAPPIIGYLPFEVLGTSGYDYYHFDDLEKVVMCHETLMQKGESTSCYHRFLTKGQQWIWLQTRFYIMYHQWNSKSEYVVGTHRVVSYADVIKMKEEGTEDTDVNETEANQNSTNEAQVDDLMPPASPSYMSEAASDAHVNSYQPISQNMLTTSTPEPQCLSPSYMSERSDSYYHSFQPIPQSLKAPQSVGRLAVSPCNVSERSDSFVSSYSPYCRPASVKSASADSTAGTINTAATTGASWPRTQARYAAGSDNGSLSGESRTSQRNSEKEGTETTLAPQYGIGAQYLDPAAYSGVVPAGMLPLSTPVLVASDQAQIQWPWQEQLQQKHEELQQMIVRQQEELRQVKEQLLLARLGIIQPLINVPNPYSTPEEMQNQQGMTAQLAYTNATPWAIGYPQNVPLPLPPLHPAQPPHPTQPPQPQHPSQPPHPPRPSESHQDMSQ